MTHTDRTRAGAAPRSRTSLNGALLLTAYLLGALLPLIVAAAADAPGRPGLHDIASTIAMIGFAALLLEFVLSGRFRALTDPVGMDALMRFHQFAGDVARRAAARAPVPVRPGPARDRRRPRRPPPAQRARRRDRFLAWFGLIGLAVHGHLPRQPAGAPTRPGASATVWARPPSPRSPGVPWARARPPPPGRGRLLDRRGGTRPAHAGGTYTP
ncbi:MAG: hypothetical protein U5K43_07415 [Halofilum sp. (in: g-proteobacteria)]|nr:hypothetical protein [Halofilum sp. (in: g-proteobacteria)]